MTEQKKGWGQTVLGWFVVREEDEQQAALDAMLPPSGSLVDAADARRKGVPVTLHAVSPPPPTPPPAPQLPVFQKEPPPAAAGKVDFPKVFEAADIDADEQERIDKSLSLLANLPAGTEPAVKKQIVEASLKAFGVPIDKIIETGVAEIQALEGYIRAVASRTQKNVDESQLRIANLEQSIKDLREEMQQQVVEQQSVLKACNDKKLEVQRILEFFGQEAVAKVVQESPKLHDPATLQ
jgi:hypothetical protein